MSDETTLWKGSPSQWLNLGPFTACIILLIGFAVAGSFFALAWAGMVVPLAYMGWRYLVVRCQVFELTTQRLRITNGVINQHIDEIELYRVKDTLMVRSWWMRLTGLSSIALQTSDRSLPNLVIPAISGGMEVREQLRKQVEAQRDSKRVREMDFDEAGDGAADGDLTDDPG
jgi:membrane protein YdbS with pleckstrin-like domain